LPGRACPTNPPGIGRSVSLDEKREMAKNRSRL
jgi:hypothetical protein